MARSSVNPGTGLQFIVDQIGELYGFEQIVLRTQQEFAARTTLADLKTNLERFAAEDQQHVENLLQALRMMLGSENGVQASTDHGRQFAEAILTATQGTPYNFVQGLVLIVSQSVLAERILLQLQQRVENREIVGLFETNHHQDERHLTYLESQLVRAAEELSLPPGR